MGVRVLADESFACMYDSVSMVAFGPVFHGEELFGSPAAAVEDFIQWFYLRHPGGDPRNLSQRELVDARSRWRVARVTGPRPDYYTDHYTNTEADAAEFERRVNG